MPLLAHDPNVAFFLLIMGLWLGVTAAYMPGTGIVEIIAGTTLVVALIMLANLPTNLGALLIIMIGVTSFAILPFLTRRPWWLAILGLGLQAAGSVLLFDRGVGVSPLLIIVTVALPFVFHTFILTPMLRRHRDQEPVVDRDSEVIGMRGRVVHALNPSGVVVVNSEEWTAEARRKLDAGMPIIVVGREGLKLLVELDKVKWDEFITDDEPLEGEQA
jgi:membrane-bound serine protease (ClpP class)